MILRRLSQLAKDRRGTALLEFAFTLPVLIILFIGSYRMSDAIACKRRVTIMRRAIRDMTSQYRELQTAEFDEIMAPSTHIMAPCSATLVQLRVTHISVEPSGQVIQVDLSRGRNTGGYVTGDIMRPPFRPPIASPTCGSSTPKPVINTTRC
ncbi:hypothetical protein [uncultured Sphingomonas sp.]|uniref:TadE/TadG family type IV pilus assembly protein n=1 Tax=uncultured Sphingomonas sp. TaxID=158754 RepID=UPI0025FB26FC|nr:hypothetical protein [uncultured Sphingomonas sp.]